MAWENEDLGLIAILSVLALAWITIHPNTRGTWPVMADGVISFVLVFYLMIMIIKQSDRTDSIETPIVGAIAASIAALCAISFTLMECMQCCTGLRHYVIARMVWTCISAYTLVVVVTEYLNLYTAINQWWPWFLTAIGTIIIAVIVYRRCCMGVAEKEISKRTHTLQFFAYSASLNLSMYITIYAIYRRYSVFVKTSPGEWKMPQDWPVYYFWLWYVCMLVFHPIFLYVTEKMGCRGQYAELPINDD